MILREGDIVRFLCKFSHKGAAYTGAKIRAAIGKNYPVIGFDEIFWNEIPVAGIKDDVDWTLYQITVDIPMRDIERLAGPLPSSGYEAYVKLMAIPGGDLFWYGPENDISFEGPAIGPALFQNLTVSYSKA